MLAMKRCRLTGIHVKLRMASQVVPWNTPASRLMPDGEVMNVAHELEIIIRIRPK